MSSTAPAKFDQNGVLDRLLAVGDRRVAVIVRVSSAKQINNDGSLETQRRQATLIQAFYPKDTIDVFEILGESAREGARRPKFEDFLRRLDSGDYGLVVAYDFDRLTRNNRDEARLLEVMKRRSILLLAKGVIYDPTDPTEEMVWRMLSLIAAYDNALRSFRAILAKAAKANDGRLAVTLPAGLGWYDPLEASYQSATESLGLEAYTLGTDSAKAFSDRNDQGRRYILPTPDRDTFTACQLLMQYMREERSLPAVLERIKNPNNRDWPAGKCGRIPVLNKTRAARHDVGRTTVGTRVIDWEPVTARLLAKFFTRPAYYGIYAVNLSKLRGALKVHAEKIGFTKRVFIENAFRSFGTSSEYYEFRAIVENTTDTRRARRDHLRIHALPPVTCGELVEGPSGEMAPCGYRLSPVYDLPGRGNVYMSAGLCRHQQKLSFNAEAAVIDLVCQCISDQQVTTAIASQGLRKRSKQAEVDKLRAELSRAEERVQNYMDYIADLKAIARRDPTDPAKANDLAEFQQQLEVQRGKRDAAKRALDKVAAEADVDESVTSKELSAVKQLAANLPKLLHDALDLVRGLPTEYEHATTEEERVRIRELAPLVRNLLGQLIRRISVRRLGHAVHEITVDFRNGASASTTVATTGTRATQAQQAWLSRRLGSGSDYAAAAAEISALLGCDGSRTRKRPWTAEEVQTAVVHYRRLYVPSDGKTVPVGGLAASLQQSERSIEAALVSHPDVQLEVRDAELAVIKDDAVLHEALPELGRRYVARRMRWPLESVIPLESVTTKPLRRQMRALAQRERRYARDASEREYIRAMPA